MTQLMSTTRRSLWRPLHVRAALIAIPLLALLCVTMFALFRHYSVQSALEATQRMNLGLARYVVDHQANTLIDVNGQPDRAGMKQLALHVMKISPAVELYLLDREGRILAHALEGVQGPNPEGRRIDLTPVRPLVDAAAETLRFPLLGDDPRHPGRRNVVSVAPLSAGGTMTGYLYIVLNGQALRSVNASLANSEALRAVAVGVVLATLLAAVVILIALRTLTRPLRQLTVEVSTFRNEVENAYPRAADDEIGILRAAFHAMQQRIAQQFKRIEDSDNQRRELVSNISHDLRTPLSSIQGYVETVLLRGEGLDATTRSQHLHTALRQVALLGKRIADLFELSKLDAGRVTPKAEVFYMAELLQDVVQNYQLAAQQRGVKLSLAAGSHLKARVLADIALIERVLQNLVDNALRYTASGGEVTVALDAYGSLLEISVSDTGCGIAEEHLPHVFERYWRAIDGEGVETGGGGAGLGLAIVKRILDLHGSVARVRSVLTRGTRIEFGLPQTS